MTIAVMNGATMTATTATTTNWKARGLGCIVDADPITASVADPTL